MEPGESVGLKDKRLEHEISPFLLLHHDYSAKLNDYEKPKIRKHRHCYIRKGRKAKACLPKIQTKRRESTATLTKRSELSIMRKGSPEVSSMKTHSKVFRLRRHLDVDTSRTHLKKSSIMKCSKNLIPTVKLKEILPKDTVSQPELIYGTYDDVANCVIIISDNDVNLGEAVTEIVTTTEEDDDIPINSIESNTDKFPTSRSVLHGMSINFLSSLTEKSVNEPPLTQDIPISESTSRLLSATSSEYMRSSTSPAPSSGYESLGSPNFDEDIWDECVSELFPTLI